MTSATERVAYAYLDQRCVFGSGDTWSMPGLALWPTDAETRGYDMVLFGTDRHWYAPGRIFG